MKRAVIGLSILAGLVGLAGCAHQEETVTPPPDYLPPSYSWAPAMTPEQAKALSPDQAKAIVIARAALEVQAKSAGYPLPNILKIAAQPSQNGWQVTVQYAGMFVNGELIAMPDSYSTVYMNSQWNVTGIAAGK